MIRPTILGIAFAVALAGCAVKSAAPSPTPSPTPSIEVPQLGPLGAAGCLPPSPIVEESAFPEVQGTPTSEDTSLFGWIMPESDGPLIRVGAELKVVWRMVGDGDLAVRLVAPDGTDRALTWGPEEHSGSNYDRPGREWGTGFAFDSTGCWALAFATATTAASVWFNVSE